MLDVSPKNLLQLVNSSESLRSYYLKASEEMVRDYQGDNYRSDQRPDEAMAENHAFEWLASITPQVIYDNPTVAVSSRVSGMDRRKIKKMQHGVNQWARDVNFWETLRQVWYDEAFRYGVVMTTFEDRPGFRGDSLGRKPKRPVCRRIAPHRFIIDPRATTPEDARFMGHIWRADKEDLLSDPRYNREEVELLLADAEIHKDLPPGAKQDDGPNRKEIVAYDIWVPEIQTGDPDEGFHGTIYTIAVNRINEEPSGEPRWIRNPRPFYGPEWGPYTLFGIYLVPDQIYPLSPLAASHAQAKELNIHAIAASRSAARHKKFIGFDPEEKEAGKAVLTVQDGGVTAIPGLKNGSAQEMSTGGVAKEQYEFIEHLRLRRDRSSGLSDEGRGMVNDDATASAVIEAGRQRATRLSYIQQMFANDTGNVLYGVAWYLWHSELSRFKMSAEASLELNPRPKSLPPEEDAERVAIEQGLPLEAVREALEWHPVEWFQGGEEMMSNGDSFEELQLVVDPMSMARTNEALQQKRMETAVSSLVDAIPVMQQAPEIEWDKLYNEYGETLNKKDLGDALTPFLSALRQQKAMQAGMMPDQMGVSGAPAEATNEAQLAGGMAAQEARVA